MHRPGHRGAELYVLVNRVDPEDVGLAVGSGVKFADQLVAVEDWQRVIAPLAFRGRLVDLDTVLESENVDCALPVEDQPIERRQQRGPTGERLIERRRVDTPCASDAVDHRRLTDLANVVRFDRALRSPGTCDAEITQPAL